MTRTKQRLSNQCPMRPNDRLISLKPRRYFTRGLTPIVRCDPSDVTNVTVFTDDHRFLTAASDDLRELSSNEGGPTRIVSLCPSRSFNEERMSFKPIERNENLFFPILDQPLQSVSDSSSLFTSEMLLSPSEYQSCSTCLETPPRRIEVAHIDYFPTDCMGPTLLLPDDF